MGNRKVQDVSKEPHNEGYRIDVPLSFRPPTLASDLSVARDAMTFSCGTRYVG